MKHFSLKELKQLSKWLSEKSQSCAKKYHELCFFIYIFLSSKKGAHRCGHYSRPT